MTVAGYRHRLRRGLLHSALEVTDDDLEIHAERAGYYLQCTNGQGGWKDLYFFTLKECSAKDFEIYNWWCSTAPQGAMKNMTIAAIQTEHGRISYDGKAIKTFELKKTGGELLENVKVQSQEQTDHELKKKFGINMDHCHLNL